MVMPGQNLCKASLKVKLQISNREAFANIVDGKAPLKLPSSQCAHPGLVSGKMPKGEGPSAPGRLLSDVIPKEASQVIEDLAANCPDWLRDTWPQFATKNPKSKLYGTSDGRVSRFARRRPDGTEETLEARNYSVRDIAIPRNLINECHWILVAKGPTIPASIIYYESGIGKSGKDGTPTIYSIFNPSKPTDKLGIRKYLEWPSQQLSAEVIPALSSENNQPGHVEAAQDNIHYRNDRSSAGPLSTRTAWKGRPQHQSSDEISSHGTSVPTASRNFAVGYGPIDAATSINEKTNDPLVSPLFQTAERLPEQAPTGDNVSHALHTSKKTTCETKDPSGIQGDSVTTATEISQPSSSPPSISHSPDPHVQSPHQSIVKNGGIEVPNVGPISNSDHPVGQVSTPIKPQSLLTSGPHHVQTPSSSGSQTVVEGGHDVDLNHAPPLVANGLKATTQSPTPRLLTTEPKEDPATLREQFKTQSSPNELCSVPSFLAHVRNHTQLVMHSP